MPLLRPEDSLAPADGRTHRPRGSPRRAPRVHAWRKREHRHPARRVRGNSGPDTVLGRFANRPYGWSSDSRKTRHRRSKRPQTFFWWARGTRSLLEFADGGVRIGMGAFRP